MNKYKLVKIWITLFIYFLANNIDGQFVAPRTAKELKEYYNELKSRQMQKLYIREDWRYEIINGAVSTMKFKEKEIAYFQDGRIKEIIDIAKDNSIKYITTFKYNKANLPVELDTYKPSGTFVGRVRYYYGRDNTIREITYYDEYRYIRYKLVLEPKPEKDIIEVTKYFTADSIDYKEILKYSKIDSGNLIVKQRLDSLDKLIFKIEYSYNASNKLNEVNHYNSSKKFEYSLEYSYGMQGRNSLEILKVTKDKLHEPAYLYKFDDFENVTGYIEYGEDKKYLKYYKYIYRKY